MSIRVEVIGAREVAAKLQAMGDQAMAVLSAVVTAGANEIQNEAKNLVPKRSRSLMRSITTTIVERSRTRAVAAVGPQEPYGVYVEFGTGEYADPAGGGSQAKHIPWRFQAADGSWVTTRGQRPQPYLRPAYDTKKDDALETIRAGFAQVFGG